MEHASNMIKHLQKGSIDLLVLPEMAFTGYVFKNREHIEPLMESEKGPTFAWCQKEAVRLGTYIAAGYPLKMIDNGVTKYLNAMCFVSPTGELIHTYSKHFLYETDKTWCDEGPGFISLDIQSLGKVGIGICMDINPWEYKDSSLYEFARFHQKEKTTIILFLANWLLSSGETLEDNSSFGTQNYWASRLKPLWGTDSLFVACNRIGTESGSTFCGGSCVLMLKKRPELLATLTKRDEGVLVVDLNNRT